MVSDTRIRIVAYGPKSDGSAHIPDYIILEDGGFKTICSDSTPNGANQCACDITIDDGQWVYMEDNKVFIFDLKNEWNVRMALSNGVMRRAQMSEPSKRLEVLQQAASLIKTDLVGLVHSLKTLSEGGGSLESMFKKYIISKKIFSDEKS